MDATSGGSLALRGDRPHDVCWRRCCLPLPGGARPHCVHLRRHGDLEHLPPRWHRPRLLDRQHDQHRLVLLLEALRLCGAAKVHRPVARQPLVGEAAGGCPQSGHPLHRVHHVQAWLDDRQGRDTLRRAGLARFSVGRRSRALPRAVRDRHPSDHLLRRAVRDERLPLLASRQVGLVDEVREFDDALRHRRELLLVGARWLGDPERARAELAPVEPAFAAERRARVAGLQGGRVEEVGRFCVEGRGRRGA
mmetsp:Transcript_7465/g.21167  ORF Transcript_7465/g.21167 Transcript_7465/m.21167 type:complete len:250 (-) Transcript_7465:572-1321(-)